ncbi:MULTISPECIES: hypothetical protein [unclassified Serratia (in: enterobacteria)]|uniref:hypothetical protein n=1 Tax=unclassified Serratia (in: enterobacteria) TaxID=2647522 RepID=UPI0030760C22
MKKLSLLVNNEVSQGRRTFLTYSSASVLSLAISSVFPTSVSAANLLFSERSTSFNELDAINFYVGQSSQNGLGLDVIRFQQETDEAQYLAQTIFQELMKQQFKSQYYGLSDSLGQAMTPNDKILGMNDGRDSASKVFQDNTDYFEEHLAEYISGMLQKSYSQQKDVPVSDRLAYNSWDMIKANANIHLAEKGEKYKAMMDRLYAIATHYCQNGLFSAYKNNGAHWARELINHYSDNNVLNNLVLSFKIQESTQSSFSKAMQKVYNTINKVRALNIASGYSIKEEELADFERTLYGAVYSGFAMSMNWGKQSEKNSLLANRQNFIDVVNLLKTDGGIFWQDFFRKYDPDSFWNNLNTLGLASYTLQDDAASQRIIQQYPELKGNGAKSLNLDSSLSTLALLLGIGHFTWATATEREEFFSPISLMELGLAFVETGLTIVISFQILLNRVSMFIFGNGEPLIEAIAVNMGKFSQFISNLCGKGKFLNNLERQVVNKLFIATSTVTRIIEICFVGLAALGAALAAYNLYQAVMEGDTADIIFASINMLIATVALGVSIAAVMGLAIAGPLGIVIAIVGLVVMIAQWLYELFKKPVIPLSPIQDYTNQVIQPRGLVYQDIGSYLCKAMTYWNGAMVCAYDAKTMNSDWDNVPHLVDREDGAVYTQAGALVTSAKTSRIYNFAKIRDAAYCHIADFFKQGTNQRLSNWYPDYALQVCTAAVESRSSSGATSALFFAANDQYAYPRAFLTQGLEDAPTGSNELRNLTEYQEFLQDVVAVNGLSEPLFLIFTNKRVHQVRGGRITTVVNDYGVGDYQNPFAMLSAITTGTTVNLLYALQNNLDPENTYHYTLTRDEQGNYTNFRLLGTRERPKASFISPIVGNFYQAKDNREARLDFMYIDASRYFRYGAIVNDAVNSPLSLHNGVEFTVPNDGFIHFYKNAFIPK